MVMMNMTIVALRILAMIKRHGLEDYKRHYRYCRHDHYHKPGHLVHTYPRTNSTKDGH